jgi:hypothetical protein
LESRNNFAADTGLDAYEEDSSVEDNEIEAELQDKQDEASVGEKSYWGLQQCVGSSSDAQIFAGHERGLRKSEAATTDKESSPEHCHALFHRSYPVVGEEASV